MTDEIAQVARQLRVPAAKLAALQSLDAADRAEFAATVGEAVARQSREIAESLEAALGFIPRPLRGRASKLLFPGGRDG